MTWNILLNGHDDLSGDEKASFEKGLVEKVKNLFDELYDTDGCRITYAVVTTNTTGPEDLLHLPPPIKEPT